MTTRKRVGQKKKTIMSKQAKECELRGSTTKYKNKKTQKKKRQETDQAYSPKIGVMTRVKVRFLGQQQEDLWTGNHKERERGQRGLPVPEEKSRAETSKLK